MILWALAAAAFGGPDCVGLDGSALEGRAGSRKMALIVGVGDYKAEPGGESIDLKGPPQDALRMRELLMERYGFPASNVCLLRDSEATRANYVRGWRDHLGRASSGDTVVYYFAGHGSQTKDFDGGTDETDGMDETILLHDSRTSGVEDLVDDEFNTLLGELYQKTTLEQLSALDPGLLILGKSGDGRTLDQDWNADSLWQQIDAVERGRLFNVSSDLWSRARGMLTAEEIAADIRDIAATLK